MSSEKPTREVTRTEEEWRSRLSPEQYRVARQSETEAPFTNKYWKFNEAGEYVCVGCDAVLFDNEEKFFSNCGWPAFDRNKQETVEESRDLSHMMIRTEVKCKKCGSHLGHLFDDGPTETGIRYCINSASLKFVPKSE